MAHSLRSLHEAINQISGPTIKEFSLPPELRQRARQVGDVISKVIDPSGAKKKVAQADAKKKKYDYCQDMFGCATDRASGMMEADEAIIKQIKIGIIDGDETPSEDFLQDFSEWQDVVTIEGASVKGRTIYFDLYFGAPAGMQRALQSNLQDAWDQFCDLEYGPTEQAGEVEEAVGGENRYRAALVNRVGAILDWLNDPDSSISQDSYNNIEPHVNAIENLINDSGDLDEAAEVDMGQLERIAKNTIGVSFQPGDKEAVVSMGNVKAALANAFRSGAKSTMEGVEGPGSKLIQPEVDRIVGNTFGKVGEKFSTTGNTIKAALLQAYQAGRKSIKSMRVEGLTEEASVSEILFKVRRVISSLNSIDQINSTKNFVDIAIKRIQRIIREKEGFGGYSKALDVAAEIQAEFWKKVERLNAEKENAQV